MAKQKVEDREKFVVRFDKPGVRESVTIVSEGQHISMNAFILQAIDEKLARGARIDRLLDLADTGARLQGIMQQANAALAKTATEKSAN